MGFSWDLVVSLGTSDDRDEEDKSNTGAFNNGLLHGLLSVTSADIGTS